MPIQSVARWRIYISPIRIYNRSASTSPLVTSDLPRILHSTRVNQLLEGIKKSKVPVEIYKTQPRKRTLFLFYSLATVQLAFWGNLGHWLFNDWTETIKATGEKVRANIVKRAIIGGVLLGIGIGAGYVFLWYPSRLITSLKILPGMHRVQLVTAGFYPFKRGVKTLTLPLDDLVLVQRLYTGKGVYGTERKSLSSFVTLRRKNLQGNYHIDSDGYFAGGGILFDRIFQHYKVK